MIRLYYTTDAKNLHDDAYALLERALKDRGITQYSLKKGARGKPYLDGVEDTFFSLSHAGSVAVCAIANAEVGVDAQDFRHGAQEKKRGQIAARFFSEAEIAYLNDADAKRKIDVFYRLWAAKEAYVKFTGEGMARDFRSFTADLKRGAIRDAGECARETTHTANIITPQTQTDQPLAYFQEPVKIPAYAVAVCAKERETVRVCARV